MRKRISLSWLTAILAVSAMFVYMAPTAASALEQCHLISFHGENGLGQKVVTVDTGDCVVWLNWTGSDNQSQNSNVELIFPEYDRCIEATNNPVGFLGEAVKGCFVSQTLGYGQTVSLVFTKAGVYNYRITSLVGPDQEGQIVVK